MKSELLNKIKNRKVDYKSVNELWQMIADEQLDVDPPYQREKVWNEEYQSQLITSIFNDWPIPYITLVTNEDNTGYIVLDGKQRITSLKSFKIKHSEKKKNLRAEHPDFDNGLTYEELSASKDKKVKMIKNSFESYKFPIVILPWMDWLEQRDVFMTLNHSMQLGNNEKTYCENFHTKTLLEQLWEDSLLKDYKCFKNNKSKLKRLGNLRLIHNILYKTFGSNLHDIPNKCNNGRGMHTAQVDKSSRFIHEELIKQNYRTGEKITDEILKKMDVQKQLNTFIDVCKSLKPVFERDSIHSKWNVSVIRDILIYFISQDYENCFTTSQIRENHQHLNVVLTDYAKEIQSNYTGAGNNNAENTEQRLKLLDKIFNDYCIKNSIDIGIKRKGISTTDINIAKLNAHKCPICDVILSDENIQIDHVNPKSKSSVTKVVALCNDCNLRKSNFSLLESVKYLKYIESNQ